MADLGSAPVPELGDEDHVRGEGGVVLIEYADYECPYCAALDGRLAELVSAVGMAAGAGTGRVGVRRVFRHFPVRSSHPRAWAAAAAAEAAGRQGAFWEMHDALFADQARLEDPHLWERARMLGLDVDRFDLERRSDEIVARVRRDFTSGVRAGVVTTPTLFWEGRAVVGEGIARLLATLM